MFLLSKKPWYPFNIFYDDPIFKNVYKIAALLSHHYSD